MYSLGYCIFYSKKGLWSKYILELVGQTTFNTCIFHFTVYSFSCASVSSHEECIMWSSSQMYLPMGLLCIVRALWETLNCAVILHSFLPRHASLSILCSLASALLSEWVLAFLSVSQIHTFRTFGHHLTPVAVSGPSLLLYLFLSWLEMPCLHYLFSEKLSLMPSVIYCD